MGGWGWEERLLCLLLFIIQQIIRAVFGDKPIAKNLQNREIVTGSAGHPSQNSRKRGREIKKKEKKNHVGVWKLKEDKKKKREKTNSGILDG